MANRYYEEKIECAPREVLRELQSKRLVEMVERCYSNVPLYKNGLMKSACCRVILNRLTM